ncbi:pseudouridine synthase [Mycoplasma buteonis]|uniref:pseudouridine synthase n=1 Tax=Mycoplasma buteonis TaxID=171280 RepID=UPI00055F4552|nr:pseudouridine synthase [Mycoplasma buteonis]
MKKRIDWVLTNYLNFSRKEAKELIKKQKVLLNNQIATLSDSYTFELDTLTVNNESFSFKEHYYFVLNKPSDYVCANKDHLNKTVFQLLDLSAQHIPNLHTVGRLDKDTTGLLLLTNDGNFTHELMSPKKHVTKTYHVILDKTLTSTEQKELILSFANGIFVSDDEIYAPSELSFINVNEALLTIHEGKYHQVKRMFQNAGYKVVALNRIKIANLELKNLNLKQGQYRELTESELKLLSVKFDK